MRKPNNYDNTEIFGDYKPLPAGAYVCRIKKVEETKSQRGNDMIIISLDIAEGEQKGYYANAYRNDDRENKKWGCTVYQVVEDNDGNTAKGFKSFVKSVVESNIGFNEDVIWNDNFASYFKDKLVGGVFRREEYQNNNGDYKWNTKCYQFRTVKAVHEGIETPKDKPMDNKPYTEPTRTTTPPVLDIDDDFDI